MPSTIKFGVRSREQQRTLEATQWSGPYVGADGVMGLNATTGRNDDNLAQFGLIERGQLDNNYVVFPTSLRPPSPATPAN